MNRYPRLEVGTATAQVEGNGFTYFILTLQEIDTTRAVLTTLGGEEVTVKFRHHPGRYVAKDLGRWARRGLGLHGRTEPGEFTQILWGSKVLGINQPLAMLLKDAEPGKLEALQVCTFCQGPLRDDHPIPGGLLPRNQVDVIPPFKYCYFCEDAPAWHHGWCCPQNHQSCMHRGATHKDQTSVMLWLRGLDILDLTDPMVDIPEVD